MARRAATVLPVRGTMTSMGAMILALAVVLIVGLLVLGLIIAERYPVSTWSGGLRALGATARQKEEPVQVLTWQIGRASCRERV